MRELLRTAIFALRRLMGTSRVDRTLDEILMAEVFRDTIRGCAWLEGESFSPRGAAANYSLLYLTFRILDECRPRSILELGAGQTTRMTARYVAHSNPEASLDVVDEDQDWLTHLGSRLPQSPSIRYRHSPTRMRSRQGFEVPCYAELPEARYDFLIVDGPHGSPHYSRSGVLDALPWLSDSFVLLIDDFERTGERETAAEIELWLKNSGRDFGACVFSAAKMQKVLFSKNLGFISWF